MAYSKRQIIGLALWWAEGTKIQKDKRWGNTWTYRIEITNTDPEIIGLFLDFLRKDVKIKESKLKLQLQIHEEDDQKYLEEFWSNITKIPKRRFNKTIIRPVGNKIGKSKGTCKVRYYSKETYKRLEEMLDNLLKSFSNRGMA